MHGIIFASLGHFIIDELVQEDSTGKQVLTETLAGGGGLYAMVGARLWMSAEQARLVVHRGFDFPEKILNVLKSYGESICWIDEPGHASFRARTTIRGSERVFQPINTRFWDDPASLHARNVPAPRFLHFLKTAIDDLDMLGGAWSSVKIIFEPMPYECIPENLRSLRQVMPRNDIFSPIETEAARLLGLSGPESGHTMTSEGVEELVASFLSFGVKEGAAVIVRCGAAGSCAGVQDGRITWTPAYFDASDAQKVVDVTGAGNAFLGGLAAGLSLGHDFDEAMLFASISASYMLEQRGPPDFAFAEGDAPRDRLAKLRSRAL